MAGKIRTSLVGGNGHPRFPGIEIFPVDYVSGFVVNFSEICSGKRFYTLLLSPVIGFLKSRIIISKNRHVHILVIIIVILRHAETFN